MAEEIKIKKKIAKRGDDGYKVVSVRMKDELIERLDKLSAETNRSRNKASSSPRFTMRSRPALASKYCLSKRSRTAI